MFFFQVRLLTASDGRVLFRYMEAPEKSPSSEVAALPRKSRRWRIVIGAILLFMVFVEVAGQQLHGSGATELLAGVAGIWLVLSGITGKGKIK